MERSYLFNFSLFSLIIVVIILLYMLFYIKICVRTQIAYGLKLIKNMLKFIQLCVLISNTTTNLMVMHEAAAAAATAAVPSCAQCVIRYIQMENNTRE